MRALLMSAVLCFTGCASCAHQQAPAPKPVIMVVPAPPPPMPCFDSRPPCSTPFDETKDT